MDNEIRKMIESLDQTPIAGRPTHIPLKYARAEDLASVLRQTYASSRRRSGDQVITITADANTNSIVVVANPPDLEGIKLMVADLDKPATLPDEELRIIPLQYIDANETLQIMTGYLKKPAGTKSATGSDLVGDVRLQASATMNSIIISGTPAQIDRVQTVLNKMDVETAGSGSAPRIVPLKKANASQLAQTLTRMFTETAQRRGGRQGTSPDLVPTILADEGSNSLIVRARQVDFVQISDMAKNLDVEITQTNFRIVPVQPGVDVEALAKEIMQTVNQSEQAKTKQQPTYRPGSVYIGVDYRGPALMVGGTPELFDMVENMVKNLAQLRPGGYMQTAEIIRLKNNNVNLQELKRMIETINDQRNGKRNK